MVDGTRLLQVKPRWRGVSHEIAAFVFPVLGLILVAIAPTTAARWSAVVYTVGVTAMYATSACYHRGDWTPPVRQRLRRLDHSMILVGIAATYTPIAVVGLDARSARILLSVVWPLAIAGIVVQMFWLDAPALARRGALRRHRVDRARLPSRAVASARRRDVLAHRLWRCRLFDRRPRVFDAPTRPRPGGVRLPRGVSRARPRGGTDLLRRDRQRVRDGLTLAALTATCARTSAGCGWCRTRPCRRRARATGLRARRGAPARSRT